MMLSAWVFLTLAKLAWDAHYFDGYDPTIPLNVVIRSEEDRPAYHRIHFNYDAYRGKAVPALLALPRDIKSPIPAIVFLHGIGQEKEFVDEIAEPFTKAGFALVSFDQYMQGERKLKNAGVLERAVALRERGKMTIIEARRLVDYLQARPDIAKDRIYLIGASYGAITGATAAALDTRFRAVDLVYGGGDLRKLMENKDVSKSAGPFHGLAVSFAEWLLGVGDPIHYVDRISPRPIFFQNGGRDRIVVPEAAKALYDAAKEPKEIKWYPSDHLDLDPQYIPIAVQDGVEWFKVQDAKIVALSGQP
jgi:dienelactone hydrolase